MDIDCPKCDVCNRLLSDDEEQTCDGCLELIDDTCEMELEDQVEYLLNT